MDERRLLGKILVDLEMVTPEQIKQALRRQQTSGRKIGEELVEMGIIDTNAVTLALGEQFSMEVVNLDDVEVPPEVMENVSRAVADEYCILPLEQHEDGSLTIVVSDPMDLFTLDYLRFILNCSITPVLAPRQSVLDAIEKTYGGKDAIFDQNHLDENIDVHEREDGRETADGEDDDAPIIRLVHQIIGEALEQRASDIHIEPFDDRVRIRYRIDGVCRETQSPPKTAQGALISRIKIMAGMDIAEKRKPQDGSISLRVQGRDIDIRVSDIPATYGESIVMRLLDKERGLLDLEQLGFDESDLTRFEKVIRRPNGIILVTGPTGSGKTTTLYSALKRLNRPDVKIITAEDPVEYVMSGINQTEVKRKIGLDFSRILKAMLRQAPNIILVGEIRDLETADAAVQASLTGHLVCSTLHTNDAPSALTRLMDMGVKPFLVASSVIAVMGQRLVRVLCEECKEAYEPTDIELKMVGMSPEMISGPKIYKASGCPTCNGTGYRGRLGVYELLEMNSELRKLVFERASVLEMTRAARRSGMTTLQEDGVRKILKGLTSTEEVVRLTHQVEAILAE